MSSVPRAQFLSRNFNEDIQACKTILLVAIEHRRHLPKVHLPNPFIRRPHAMTLQCHEPVGS
jgi:hypothetical protein